MRTIFWTWLYILSLLTYAVFAGCPLDGSVSIASLSSSCPLTSSGTQDLEQPLTLTSLCAKFYKVSNPNGCAVSFSWYDYFNPFTVTGSANVGAFGTYTFATTAAGGTIVLEVDSVVQQAVQGSYVVCSDSVQETASYDLGTTPALTMDNVKQSYSVVLTAPPNGDSVILAQSDAYSLTTPYRLNFNSENWNVAQYVSVQAVADEHYLGPSFKSVISHKCEDSGETMATLNVPIASALQAGITVSPSTISVTEGDSTGQTVSVRLSSKPFSTVSITFNGGQNLLLNGASTAVVEVAPDDWSKTTSLKITAVNNGVDEGDSYTTTVTYTVSSADAFYSIGSATTAVTATVTNVNSAGVQFSSPMISLAMGSGSATYSVRLSSVPQATVTLQISVPSCLTVSPSSLQFTSANWNTLKTVSVSASGCTADEDSQIATKYISHSVSSADSKYSASLEVSDLQVSVIVTKSVGVTVSAPSSMTVTSGGADSWFGIHLNSAPSQSVTVSFTYDSSLVSLSQGSVTFTSSNWKTAQLVTVSAVTSYSSAAPKSTQITFTTSSSDSQYSGVCQTTRCYTGPVGTGSDLKYRVFSNSNLQKANFNYADLTGADFKNTNLQQATFVGAILTGADFRYTNLQKTDFTGAQIANGLFRNTNLQQSTFVSADLENADMSLSNLQHADFSCANLAGVDFSNSNLQKITTDSNTAWGDSSTTCLQPIPELSVTVASAYTAGIQMSANAMSVQEGSQSTYTLLLSSAPNSPVVIAPQVSNGAPFTVSPSSITFSAGNWNVPQTYTVSATDDSICQGSRSVDITHTVTTADTDYSALNAGTVTVTVTDNEVPAVHVNPTSRSIVEGLNSASYGISLSCSPLSPVSVVFAYDSSSVAVDQQQVTLNSDNWNTGVTVTVSAVNDFVASGDRSKTIGHTASSESSLFNGLTIPVVTLSIAEDDVAGVVVAASSSAVNADASVTVTVSLTSQPVSTVTVTATGDSYVSISPASLTFTSDNWNQGQTFTVTGVNTFMQEPDHPSVVSFSTESSDSNYAAGAVTVPSTTITVHQLSTAGIEVSKTSVAVSEMGAVDTYSIRLTSKPAAAVTIAFQVDAAHLQAISSVTIQPNDWATAQWITVEAVRDFVQTVAAGSSFTSTIAHTVASQDTNYNGFATDSVTVAITDADVAGVTVSKDGDLVVTESGVTASYQIVLNSKPAANVVVSVASSHNNVAATQSLTFTPDNWSSPQTVTVSASKDNVDQGSSYSAELTHSVASADNFYSAVSVASVSITVMDADSAGVTVNITSASLSQAGEETEYSVWLHTIPSSAVTVEIASSDSDVTVSPNSVVFDSSNWNTPATVTIRTVDNGINQGDVVRTITHAILSADAVYNGLSVPSIAVTVVGVYHENLDISGTDLTVSESGAVTAQYTIKLKRMPTASVTIEITDATGRVTATPSSVTFTPADWNQPKVIEIASSNDYVVQVGFGNTYQSTLTHSISSTDPAFSDSQSVDVNVIDMNVASVSFSFLTVSVTRGGSAAQYAVKLTSKPSSSVTVTVALPDGSDLTVSPTTLVFDSSNFNTEQSVAVSAPEDFIARADYDVILSHSVASQDSGYNGLTLSSVTVTVHASRTAGLSAWIDGAATIKEGSDKGSLCIVLLSRPSDSVTVSPNAAANTGLQFAPSTVVFGTGVNDWSSPQCFEASIAQDYVAQGNRQVQVSVSSASSDSSYSGLASGSTSFTVLDADVAGCNVIGSVDIAEGAQGSYSLVLTSSPQADVTVSVQVPTGLAVVGSSSLTFTSANWNVPQTVTIAAERNWKADGGAVFEVAHTVTSADSLYNGLEVSSASVTVTDLDVAGVVLSSSLLAVAEGESTSFTVQLSSIPSANVVLSFAVSSTLQTTVTESIEFTASNWNQPQTVTLAVQHDSAAIGTQSITISTSVQSNDAGYNGMTVTPVTVTVSDIDHAGVVVVKSQSSVSKGDSMTFDISLTSKPLQDVVINFGLPDGCSISPSSITFDSSSWSQVQTVTLSVQQDTVASGDKAVALTITVQSADMTYNSLNVPSTSFTILDNVHAGVVTPAVVSVQEGSAGQSVGISLVLTSTPSSAVTVSLSIEGSRLEFSAAELVFTSENWNVPQSVDVTAVNDNTDYGDSAVEVLYAVTSADPVYNGIHISSTMVSVIENDHAGFVLSSDSITLTEGDLQTQTDFTIKLSTMPLHPVTINFTSDMVQFNGQNSIQLVFTPDNWNVTQTVSVQAPSDSVQRVSGDDTYDADVTVSVSSEDPVYAAVSAPSITFHLYEGDLPAAVILLTNTASPMTASENKWLAFSFTATATVTDFAVTVDESGLPAGTTIAYPSDRAFTSLYNWDYLPLGDVDFVAVKLGLPGPSNVDVSSLTLALTVNYKLHGVSKVQHFTAALPIVSAPEVAFALSHDDIEITAGSSKWVGFTVTAQTGLSNFQLSIQDPESQGVQVTYPFDGTFTSLYKSDSLDSGATDVANLLLTVPSSTTSGMKFLTAVVSWVDSAPRQKLVQVAVTVHHASGAESAGRRLSEAADVVIEGNGILGNRVYSSATPTASLISVRAAAGLILSDVSAVLTAPSGFTVTHSDGSQSALRGASSLTDSVSGYFQVTVEGPSVAPTSDNCYVGFLLTVQYSVGGVEKSSSHKMALCVYLNKAVLSDSLPSVDRTTNKLHSAVSIENVDGSVLHNFEVEVLSQPAGVTVTPKSVPSEVGPEGSLFAIDVTVDNDAYEDGADVVAMLGYRYNTMGSSLRLSPLSITIEPMAGSGGSQPEESNTSDNTNVLMGIGIAIGAFACVAILAVVAFVARRRKIRRAVQPSRVSVRSASPDIPPREFLL